ncbi:hypothetical protein AAP_00450 [Ascosphaera apis ARSEF 7405]|uniref:Uncharacterized protein n=1 Tax=Ascosphaera apis ARSEF 7405 TaxID=392613 RepID=A0A168DWF4_9EURO|nr:hypothetical protein AAP_00450 [Ascosphaera apis ARSEF 7405]
MQSTAPADEAAQADGSASTAASFLSTNTPPPSQAPAAARQSSTSSVYFENNTDVQSITSSQPPIESPELASQSLSDNVDTVGATTEASPASNSHGNTSVATEKGFTQDMRSTSGPPKSVDVKSTNSSNPREVADKLMTTTADSRAASSISEIQNEMSRMVNEEAAQRAIVDRQLNERNLELLRGVKGSDIRQSQQSKPQVNISQTEARLQESLRRIAELEGYVRSLQERVDHANLFIRDCCSERESLRDENRALKKHILENRAQVDWLLTSSQSNPSHHWQLSQTSAPHGNPYPPLSQSASQRSGSDYEGLDIILAAANSSDSGMLSSGHHYRYQQPSQQDNYGIHHPSQSQGTPSFSKSTLFANQPSQSFQEDHNNDDATVVGSDVSDNETVGNINHISYVPRQSPTIEERVSWLRERTPEIRKRSHQSTLHQYGRVDKPGASAKRKKTAGRV